MLATPELALLAALAVGVVGSVVPGVPGGAVSVAGVAGYYLLAPSPAFGVVAFAGLLALAIVAALVGLFGGAVAAAGRDVAPVTVAAAGLAGVALLFVVGPLGVLVGVFGVVFAAEVVTGADGDDAVVDALWATVGVLAGTVGEALFALAALVAGVVVVVL
ncbi:MAG: DUF456 family protein [Halolamina sp.]